MEEEGGGRREMVCVAERDDAVEEVPEMVDDEDFLAFVVGFVDDVVVVLFGVTRPFLASGSIDCRRRNKLGRSLKLLFLSLLPLSLSLSRR